MAQWTTREMGEAMVAAVVALAPCSRPRGRGRVECPVWFELDERTRRPRDNPASLIVDPATAVAYDARRRRAYTAKTFAGALGMTLPELMARYGCGPTEPARRPQSPPPSAPGVDELRALLRCCRRVTTDRAAVAFLEGRSIDPWAVAERRLALVLPVDAPRFRWARQSGVPWQETGHRLIVPTFDPNGRLAGVQARSLEDKPDHKSLNPHGDGAIRGKAMACPFAVEVLRGPAGAHLVELSRALWCQGLAASVVVEGVPDFLRWASAFDVEDPEAPAVFGIVNGSWSNELAARFPDGATVCIATHHDDPGEGYAARVVESFEGRDIGLLRHPGDDDDESGAATMPAEDEAR